MLPLEGQEGHKHVHEVLLDDPAVLQPTLLVESPGCYEGLEVLEEKISRFISSLISP